MGARSLRARSRTVVPARAGACASGLAGRPGGRPDAVHLDIAVDDLAAGVAHAESLGAELAGHQPQDDVRVLLDPAGHPFCLFQMAKDDPRW